MTSFVVIIVTVNVIPETKLISTFGVNEAKVPITIGYSYVVLPATDVLTDAGCSVSNAKAPVTYSDVKYLASPEEYV